MFESDERMVVGKTHARAKAASRKTAGPGEADREEGKEILDRAAHRYLQMSGDEFMAKWDAGEFPEVDQPDVLNVALLLPFVR